MKSRSVLVAFFVLCTAVLALFPFSQPAAAAPYEPWARWFIEVTFANNKPLTTMTVEIGHDNRLGLHVVDLQKVYELPCQETGNLTVISNAAVFDGKSYLTCEMPVFQDIVAELTEGKLKIDSTCDCKQANGEVEFAFADPSGNPFFYMEGLQFAAPKLPVGPDAQYAMTVDGITAVSEVFMPNKQLQHGVGEFLQNGKQYQLLFELDGASLGSSPSAYSGLLKVPTNQKQFFIGFNPDTGEILQGTLGYLFIDPGCVGHGGI